MKSIYIKDIVIKFGKDLRDVNLMNKNLSNYDFSDILLPKDYDLFQKIVDKDLSNCVFDSIDFSIYNMNDVNISGVKFKDKVKLPMDNLFFQKIKNKDLSNVSLPHGDYSFYNFEGVNFVGVKFTSNSSLCIEKDMFQKIKGKNLNFAVLPVGDYSICDFDGVSLYYTKFGKSSLIPKDYMLFKKVSMMKNSSIPDNCIDDIHLYDLKNIPYNLRISGLDPVQTAILYKKYYEDESVNSKITISNI